MTTTLKKPAARPWALLLALIVLLLSFVGGTAHAADKAPVKPPNTLKFGMGPANHVPVKQTVDGRAYLTYSANPGATVIDKVAVLNYDVKALRLQVYATDAIQSSDGAFGLLPGDSTPSDAGSWIKLRVPKDGYITIPGRTGKAAFGTKVVTFEARIPRDAAPGDHVGGIVGSLKSVSKNPQGANVTLDQRIGVRAYFTLTGKVVPKVVVEDLKASYGSNWDPLGRGDYTVSYFVHNKGNLRLDVKQTVNVKRCLIPGISCPLAGDLVDHPRELHELLPGARVQVTQTFTGKFGFGLPTAEVRLDATPSEARFKKTEIAPVTASTVFWALPWLLIIEILVVLLAIGYGVWRYLRRRQERADERAYLEANPPKKSSD